jgi:hypothetical protein
MSGIDEGRQDDRGEACFLLYSNPTQDFRPCASVSKGEQAAALEVLRFNGSSTGP